MPQTITDQDITVLVMTVVQAGDAPGGGGQLPEFPGGGGGGQGAGPPPALLPSQCSFHPLPATECHRSSGWQRRNQFPGSGSTCFFGPPGSGSISQRYGSGSSGKNSKKTLIPTVL
jgi:hypothetical protein